MRIVIISGLSGSGKTIALQAYEDDGFYCIDNLPATLLHEFIISTVHTNTRDIAISIDSRNREFLAKLPDQLEKLDAKAFSYQILFIDAEDEVLIKRYKETRRKHPLSSDTVSLPEAIKLERTLLSPLKEQAHRQFETTNKTPHELRRLVRDFIGAGKSNEPVLLFESFGYKYGLPRDADFVFDVRCLPNPHWDEKLRGFTGQDKVIIDFLQSYDVVNEMIDDIGKIIEKWLPEFSKENRSYITVAIGCTGGKHRSVHISEKLAAKFKDSATTQLRHRELNRQ